MKIRTAALVALLSTVSVVGQAPSSFDVRAFGAKGDGKSLDTDAINNAIAAAHAAGGGTVRFGAGTYLSTSIRLQSHVGLFLDHGSTILAAEATVGPYDEPEPNEWDKFQDFGHSHWHNSLIWGENLDDVSITGPGLIHGKGLVRSYNANTTPKGSGNKAIALKNGRNILIRDVSILHGGWFAILATGVDNVTIDNIKIDTNRYGIDVDACKNVRISNATVNSPFDDGICLKSSYGLGSAKPTENVTITNLTIRDIVNAPIFVRLGRRARGPGNPPPGVINRVRISNVVASNVDSRHGVLVSGIPGHDIEDLRLSDIRIAYQGGGTAADAALQPEEKEAEYPEPDMFGNTPAYGMYARHVKTLSARDIVFTTDKPDARPAFRFEDVAGVDLDRVIVPRTAAPVFVLQRLTDFLLRNSPGLPDKRLAQAAKESF